jgi:hypothetical protein
VLNASLAAPELGRRLADVHREACEPNDVVALRGAELDSRRRAIELHHAGAQGARGGAVLAVVLVEQPMRDGEGFHEQRVTYTQESAPNTRAATRERHAASAQVRHFSCLNRLRAVRPFRRHSLLLSVLMRRVLVLSLCSLVPACHSEERKPVTPPAPPPPTLVASTSGSTSVAPLPLESAPSAPNTRAAHFFDLRFVDDAHAWAFSPRNDAAKKGEPSHGARTSVVVSDDGGAHFHETKVPLVVLGDDEHTDHFEALAATSPTDAWICIRQAAGAATRNEFAVHHTTDGGATWSKSEIHLGDPSGAGTCKLHAVDGGLVFADLDVSNSGEGSDHFLFFKQGASFTRVAKLPGRGPVTMISAKDGVGVLGATIGGPFVPYSTRDGGRTWNLVEHPRLSTPTSVEDMQGNPAGMLMIAARTAKSAGETAKASGTFLSSDGGHTWRIGPDAPCAPNAVNPIQLAMHRGRTLAICAADKPWTLHAWNASASGGSWTPITPEHVDPLPAPARKNEPVGASAARKTAPAETPFVSGLVPVGSATWLLSIAYERGFAPSHADSEPTVFYRTTDGGKTYSLLFPALDALAPQ